MASDGRGPGKESTVINHPSYKNDMGPGAEETVARAIRESVRENRTVKLDYSESIAEILDRDCDGTSESEHTYWGTRDEEDGGGEWQITLVSEEE